MNKYENHMIFPFKPYFTLFFMFSDMLRQIPLDFFEEE